MNNDTYRVWVYTDHQNMLFSTILITVIMASFTILTPFEQMPKTSQIIVLIMRTLLGFILLTKLAFYIHTQTHSKMR